MHFTRKLLRCLALLLCVLVPLHAQDILPQRFPAGMRVQDFRQLAAQPAVRKEAAADAGDSYRLPDGREIRLLRATESAAVAFPSAAQRDRGLAGLKARKEIPAHSEAARAQFRKGSSFHIVRSEKAGTAMDPKALQGEPSVAYARHVLIEPKSRTRMIATDEILAAFPENTTPAQMRALVAGANLQIVARAGNAKLNAWRLRLANPKTGDPLQIARTLSLAKGVLWAQPNFLREIKHCFTPPNPLFGKQQALSNLGLNGAVAGADAKATTAWDKTTGSGSIVIAIIDDGVDINHPGLRIFTNPGESGNGKETNALDDDGNGFLNDVHGWDFANNDNNPSPVGTNGHGTGTAGVAAGTFSVGTKTAGMAGGCTVLPVKIADDTGDFTTDAAIGTAIIYASTFADVLSNSWGGGSESPFIDAAIDYAVAHGRGGKGCPVFFATGNYASPWLSGGGRARLSTQGLNGSYYFGFYYGRNATADGEETVRIDNVCVIGTDGFTHRTDLLPNEDLENWFTFGPFYILASGNWQGIASTGAPLWTIETTNAMKGTGGIYSAASPQLANGQASVFITPPISVTGAETLAFSQSFSMSADSDFYVLLFDGITGSFTGLAYGPWHGPPDPLSPESLYPASYMKTIAVGAATDCDRRSDYSGYLGHLDFLAPSNGGWNDIATLDPLGPIGWTPDDFKMNFGGTSSATPLAAGIAALMLSVNPTLTENEIRTILHSTCDKIGGVSYGWTGTHPEYGYGRVNAARAVESAMPSLSISDVTVSEGTAATPGIANFTITLSAATIRDVTVQWNTVDATALAGTNYTGASGTITIPAGSTTAQVSVNLIGAVLAKPSAFFLLRLGNATNATIFLSNGKGTLTALDTDGDGIPDYWENSHGLKPNDPTDAALDPDGDGLTNLQEFLAGSNPHDGADPTRIVSSNMAGGGFAFTLQTIAGRTYRIEYKNALTDPEWQIFGADFTATGSSLQISDPGVFPGQPSRFYRARVLP